MVGVSAKDVLQQTSQNLQAQIELLERQQQQPRTQMRSRSPRRHGSSSGRAEEEEEPRVTVLGKSSRGQDPSMGMNPMAAMMMGMMSGMAMMSSMAMANMRQMPSMAAMGNGDDDEAEEDQQQQQMRQMQQQMMMGMGQMGAMGAMQQQMMMGMGGMQGSGCDAAMQVHGGSSSNSSGGDQRETERQMGRQAYAKAMAALKRQGVPSDEEEGDVPPGHSSSVHHPNYRPLDSQPVPGVTDRRFEGQIKIWVEDRGYGLIVCEALKQRYPDNEVFLHQNQRRHFEKGAWVSFSVFINFRGKPQATELRRVRRDASGRQREAA